MLFRPTTVRDDRGKRIKLTLSRLDAEGRLKNHHKQVMEQLARRSRERRDAAGLEKAKPPKWWQRLHQWPVSIVFGIGAIVGGLGFIAGIVLAISAPLIAGAALLGYPWQTGVLATFVLAIGIASVLGWRRREQSRYERAKALAKIKVCGMCGYSLEHLEPGSDGKIECPECGAGWDIASKSTPLCAGCYEPLETLIVTEPGVAECPGCHQKFNFSANNLAHPEDAMDGS